MNRKRELVICLNNEGNEASLERRKVYEVIPDEQASERGLIRVIDESGDDYLYPERLFMPLSLPANVQEAVLAAD